MGEADVTQTCSECGAEIDPDAIYCPECGEALDDAADEQEGPTTHWAARAHMLGFVFGIVGALVIYGISDDEFVIQNAANAFNFQLTADALFLIGIAVAFVHTISGGILFLIVAALDLGFSFKATVKASNGEAWSYPGAVPILQP